MNTTSHSASIREILLTVIRESQPQDNMSESLQQTSILDKSARRLAESLDPTFSRRQDLREMSNFAQQQMRYSQTSLSLSPDMQEALLTQWGELFRTGLLAWGLNLSNPNQPFFHLTERGRNALANASRDPSNPAGYLRHLDTFSTLNDVTRSYLVEGLDCYVAGLMKSAAVMIGAASESIILVLADHTKKQMDSIGKVGPRGLTDWRVKTLLDSLKSIFDQNKGLMSNDLRESVEANWPTFTYQIRATRNEAGHPTSVDPVTPDRVHASLLAFPEVARLAQRLTEWVTSELR